jgi:hypothetical protein
MELLKALWNVVKAIANVFVVLYNYIKPAVIKFIKHKPEVAPIAETPAPATPAPVVNQHGATTTVAQ